MLVNISLPDPIIVYNVWVNISLPDSIIVYNVWENISLLDFSTSHIRPGRLFFNVSFMFLANFWQGCIEDQQLDMLQIFPFHDILVKRRISFYATCH